MNYKNKRRYRKRASKPASKRKYYKRRSKKRTTKRHTKSDAKFVRRVIQRTLHPEKKRYNAMRTSPSSEANKDWALYNYGINMVSTDATTVNAVPNNMNLDSGKRSPYTWYTLNPKPLCGTNDSAAFYNISGSNMNLKYIYIKGHVKIIKQNINLSVLHSINTALGHLKIKVAYTTHNELELDDYSSMYDNVNADSTNLKNLVKMDTDNDLWLLYHRKMLKQDRYSDVKIWTIKRFKWHRWNKAQTAIGSINSGTGAIVEHCDDGSNELLIPFSKLIRVNKYIMYDKSNNNYYNERQPQNYVYKYCVESDCGIENKEWEISMGAVGVFTDC